MSELNLQYEVCVDWDATNWAATPDFSQPYDNITNDLDPDVNAISIERGKEWEEGLSPAATMEVRMRPGLVEKYSPFTTGVLQGKIRPMLPIRLRIKHNDQWRPQFFGFITRISVNPVVGKERVILYCTDGTDLLARQIITQDFRNKARMSDGEAVEKVLDAAGWSTERRDIDKDGGDELLSYPACHPY